MLAIMMCAKRTFARPVRHANDCNLSNTHVCRSNRANSSMHCAFFFFPFPPFVVAATTMGAELAELTLTTDGTAFKKIQTTMILVRAAKAAATKRGTGGAFQARLFKEVRFF